MPFRTAHGVAAKAVRIAIEKKCNLEELDISTLQECSQLIQNDIYSCISPKQCMEGRKTTGGPAPEKVKAQISMLQDYCVKNSL